MNQQDNRSFESCVKSVGLSFALQLYLGRPEADQTFRQPNQFPLAVWVTAYEAIEDDDVRAAICKYAIDHVTATVNELIDVALQNLEAESTDRLQDAIIRRLRRERVSSEDAMRISLLIESVAVERKADARVNVGHLNALVNTSIALMLTSGSFEMLVRAYDVLPYHLQHPMKRALRFHLLEEATTLGELSEVLRLYATLPHSASGCFNEEARLLQSIEACDASFAILRSTFEQTVRFTHTLAGQSVQRILLDKMRAQLP